MSQPPAPSAASATRPVVAAAPREACDVCGSDDVYELKCKVVCRNCHTILRTCADLA